MKCHILPAVLIAKLRQINIEDIGMSREELFKITGGMTVPQIVINNQCIGGFDDLFNLSQSGELQKLIK